MSRSFMRSSPFKLLMIILPLLGISMCFSPAVAEEHASEMRHRLPERQAPEQPQLIAQATTDQKGVNGQLMIVPPEDEIIEWDKPIGIGPYPVNGRTIAELIEGTPLFSPIEGLHESIWKKTCSSCHQWNRERLCDQGKTYAGQNIRLVLRHPHPYGGPFKLALYRWAKAGCR
jgi:hypothetical protein